MSDTASKDEVMISTAAEAQLAELIRSGGARSQPSAEVAAAIRSAVRAEWQDVISRRVQQRRRIWTLAAAAAVAGLVTWALLPTLQAPVIPVATVERLTGPAEVGGNGLLGRFTALRAGASVAVGDEIRSGQGGRLALRIGGLSLRMDEQSSIAMLAADRVELRRGALYVDSGAAAEGSAQLEVDTPYGVVRHLGTQYETRLLADRLRVRVREGIVSVTRDSTVEEGKAGDELMLTGDRVSRAAVARDSHEWGWAAEIAPVYLLDNRSLAEFLQWVGRETGREVVFATSAAEAEARRISLRGSADGLSPDRALAAVMSTTALSYGEQAGDLLIGFRSNTHEQGNE